MPETAAPTSANPTTEKAPKRSRPPGEMGGHTVQPWEQPESGQGTSSVQAGSDTASPASGGSSKSVPPPANGPNRDGLGQGAGASTVKAAEGMMPPASETAGVRAPPPVAGPPPHGSAGAPARPNARSQPQPTQPDLEERNPEGAEAAARQPKGAMEVGRDDAPEDAMRGAPATARKATPQATRDAPEQQVEGGDAARTPVAERSATVASKPAQRAAKPAPPTAMEGTQPKTGSTAPAAPTKPQPAAVDAAAKASAPKPAAPVASKREAAPSPMVPSTGADAAKAASGGAVHPTNPAMQATSGEHDPADDRLIEALDKRLAEMLARALHETVATAVRETRTAPRPPAPPPVRPAAAPAKK